MTIFGPAIDTRPVFARERAALLDLLGSLSARDWMRPTVCPGWDVHDVVGHILNDYVRRLSGSRDRHGGAVFRNDETLPAYLARTNDEFVRAMRQCSPRLMVELLSQLGPQLDTLWSARELDTPADLDVSWAATDIPSPAWLDIAREYTEFWVHQQQIRDALARPGADDAELMGPVIATFLRALPQALHAEPRPAGTSVRFEVTGPAGGVWSATRGPDRWRMSTDPAGEPTAGVVMDQDALWRLACRAITVEQARGRSQLCGERELTMAATTLLAVVA